MIEASAEYKDEAKQYFASVIPQELGDHELMVTVRNRPVQGSPFPMWVREPTDWTELSTLASQLIPPSEMGNNYIYGLALHADGNLYVTENDYVRIVDLKASKTITIFGKSGSGDKEFSSPLASS